MGLSLVDTSYLVRRVVVSLNRPISVPRKMPVRQECQNPNWDSPMLLEERRVKEERSGPPQVYLSPAQILNTDA